MSPPHPTTFAMPQGMSGGAAFSDDRRYRHFLWRLWPSEPLGDFDPHERLMLDQRRFSELGTPYALFIGHNPSRAGADMNDMTVIREIDITRRLGYCCYIKMNVADYCATDPQELAGKHEVVASHYNHDLIMHAAKYAARVILATGKPHKEIADRTMRLFHAISLVADTWCMGTTSDGWPRHPSRLANHTPCIPYFQHKGA